MSKKPRGQHARVGHNQYYYWYCVHIVHSRSIREIARETGLAASTFSRQFRKIEILRDDAVFDAVIERLCARDFLEMEIKDIKMKLKNDTNFGLSEEQIAFEARRILRRLAERNTVLLAKSDLDIAGVFRQAKSGLQRLCVVPRPMVEEFILRDWIAIERQNKVGRYILTPNGRTALKRMLAGTRNDDILREEATEFIGENPKPDSHAASVDNARRFRVNFTENPINALARRRDKKGNPYLSARQIAAGERIREDFEVAQIGAHVTKNWDRFLESATCGNLKHAGITSPISVEAHSRWTSAMGTLGSGLGDIAFRVCCMLEGLETAERRLG